VPNETNQLYTQTNTAAHNILQTTYAEQLKPGRAASDLLLSGLDEGDDAVLEPPQ
jgi:hypothetical protein